MPELHVDCIGATETALRLGRISTRLWDLEPVFEGLMRQFEALELERFESFTPPGWYVDTGATKASLTQSSADGAIREAHMTADGAEMEFGSSVDHARYLRKPPVLLSASHIRRRAGAAVLAYIVGHRDGRTRRAGIQNR